MCAHLFTEVHQSHSHSKQKTCSAAWTRAHTNTHANTRKGVRRCLDTLCSAKSIIRDTPSLPALSPWLWATDWPPLSAGRHALHTKLPPAFIFRCNACEHACMRTHTNTIKRALAHKYRDTESAVNMPHTSYSPDHPWLCTSERLLRMSPSLACKRISLLCIFELPRGAPVRCAWRRARSHAPRVVLACAQGTVAALMLAAAAGAGQAAYRPPAPTASPHHVGSGTAAAFRASAGG